MTLFDVFRRLLFFGVGSYALFRAIAFIWRWNVAGRGADRTESMLRRYAVSVLVRTRVRRFWWDFVQIAGLAMVLAFLLQRHRSV